MMDQGWDTDGWGSFSRLERDIARAGIIVVTIASLIGAAIGWLGHQLLEHLHDEGRSEHFGGSR